MNIGIIGQGAIGSLFAYYYRHESPTLLVKDCSKITKKLLTLEGIHANLDFHTTEVAQANISKNSTEHFDAIIIAVKGYQMEKLISQLIPWVPVNTRLVLIQNGMGGAQLLAKAFPEHLIYTGTTTDAVYSIDKYTYKITAVGKLEIGPLWLMSSCQSYTPKIIDSMDEKIWAEAFFSCHPNYEYHEDVAPALYTKLAINAVINPLTATLQIKNGQLCQYPDQVETLKLEIFKVYSAANVRYSRKALSLAIDNVITATSNNWSSMQQDIEHHRQTENDTVLGFLLSLAAQFKVKTPLIKKLYIELKSLEQ